MQLSANAKINHPPEAVFKVFRDHLTDLVSYLSNVETVEIVKREETPPVVRVQSRWQGSSNDVPKLIRPFMSPEMFAWIDDAKWNEEQLGCAWTIASIKIEGFLHCEGTTELKPGPDNSTQFCLTGNLTVNAAKIPGVPRLLSGRIRGPIEQFLSSIISPNLTELATAVGQYLDKA